MKRKNKRKNESPRQFTIIRTYPTNLTKSPTELWESSNRSCQLFDRVSVHLSLFLVVKLTSGRGRDFIEENVSDTACCQLVSANEYGLSRTAVPRQRWKCRIGAARFDRSILSAVATAFEGRHRICIEEALRCHAWLRFCTFTSPPLPSPSFDVYSLWNFPRYVGKWK